MFCWEGNIGKVKSLDSEWICKIPYEEEIPVNRQYNSNVAKQHKQRIGRSEIAVVVVIPDKKRLSDRRKCA